MFLHTMCVCVCVCGIESCKVVGSQTFSGLFVFLVLGWCLLLVLFLVPSREKSRCPRKKKSRMPFQSGRKLCWRGKLKDSNIDTYFKSFSLSSNLYILYNIAHFNVFLYLKFKNI